MKFHYFFFFLYDEKIEQILIISSKSIKLPRNSKVQIKILLLKTMSVTSMCRKVFRVAAALATLMLQGAYEQGTEYYNYCKL